MAKNFAFLSVFLVAMSVDALSTAANNQAGPMDEGSERLARWTKKWSDNDIKFHQADVNHILRKHGGLILPDPSRRDAGGASCDAGGGRVRVFVPLCGKTVDLAYLAGHDGAEEIVGLEGVSKALEEFSNENPALEVKNAGVRGPFERWEGRGVTLLRGDLFDATEEATGGRFDAVWDRASLVAIRPELREDYVAVTGRLLKPGGTILLATLDRRAGSEEAMASGPPFSLNEVDVRALYGAADWVDSVTMVEEYDEFLDEASRERWTGRGMTSVFEICFVIKAKR